MALYATCHRFLGLMSVSGMEKSGYLVADLTAVNARTRLARRNGQVGGRDRSGNTARG